MLLILIICTWCISAWESREHGLKTKLEPAIKTQNTHAQNTKNCFSPSTHHFSFYTYSTFMKLSIYHSLKLHFTHSYTAGLQFWKLLIWTTISRKINFFVTYKKLIWKDIKWHRKIWNVNFEAYGVNSTAYGMPIRKICYGVFFCVCTRKENYLFFSLPKSQSGKL